MATSSPDLRVGAEAVYPRSARRRARVVIRGAVQGVGFRPFVFRLALELGLTGWVANSNQGVIAEVEGSPAGVDEFILRLERDRPPHSYIQGLEASQLDPLGYTEFEIRFSSGTGELTALVLPDIATCPDCRREIFDPADRRYRYPFTNCTHCGPRFSLIEALPYDRANTAMKGFTLCPACQREYDDPADRRFHAQPNACPVCGPQLELWDAGGRCVQRRDDALLEAIAALRKGAIVAVKGLGGFHLMTLAGDDAAVRRLRARKHREEKPLALMFPSLVEVREHCEVGPLEARLLEAAEAPIVLLRRRLGAGVAGSVAPGNPDLGVMLPSTPLHHLLLAGVKAPLVATSGNRSDEPICTDEREVVARLGGIADGFLVHNRPIIRHVDDSIVRVMLGREMVLRRARGYAPLPVTVREELAPTVAVGAHLKNTVAFAKGRQVFLSQHIGDLDTPPAVAAFTGVLNDLGRLLGVKPEGVGADLHPDYFSTRHAQTMARRVICVQHHYAHILSCMAENNVLAPALGVAWDGTGFGPDETIWGGEFLLITEDHFQRVGHLRTFPLPGGEPAVVEPRRSALGLLFALLGEGAFALEDLPPWRAFTSSERNLLTQMLRQGLQAPMTSSAGRLFDAVASLLGLRQRTRFEGQAAMDLEFAIEADDSEEVFPMPLVDAGPAVAGGAARTVPASARHGGCAGFLPAAPWFVADWGPMIERMIATLRVGQPVWEIAAMFHNTLAECVAAAARRVGQRRVVLSGGCFQNRYLLERTVQRLCQNGFSAYWHQRVPTNDGGLALGQAIAAAWALGKS
ncbi:MAG: carbamoyltransferase HypF [Verrucomicrobiota bacterium]|jgi:hydrogenase maturation protein HypF